MHHTPRCNKTNFNVEKIPRLVVCFMFVWFLPMFMFDLWLPRTNVATPVSGAMILAGVLLKLGGYELLRVFPVFKYGFGFAIF
jgi:NADH:ubiquinone oxidoreductase subunit 4 (chain M)